MSIKPALLRVSRHLSRAVLSVPLHVKVTGMALLITLMVGVVAMSQLRTDTYRTMTAELDHRGRMVAMGLASTGSEDLVLRDRVNLKMLLLDTVEHDQDIAYAFLVDADGRVVASTFDGAVPAGLVDAGRRVAAASSGVGTVSTDEGSIRHIVAPVLDGRAGQVHVGMSEARVMSLVDDSTARLLYAVSLATLLAVALALLLGRILVAPLRSLVMAMGAVGRGDLEHRLEPFSDDEVGFLTDSFNRMVDELRAETAQSHSYLKRLERRNRELATLHLLSTENAGSLSPSEYLERAVALTVESLSAAAGWACVRRPDGEGAWVAALGTAEDLVRSSCDPQTCTSIDSVEGEVPEDAREAACAGKDFGCPVLDRVTEVGHGEDPDVPGCAVPGVVATEDRRLGLLVLVCKAGGLGCEDEHVVESSARRIGLVIENLVLREEGEAHEARLARLLSHTLDAREDERGRVARELHDETGQQLTYLKLGLKVLADGLDGDIGSAGLVAKLQRTATECMSGIRAMVSSLRPVALGEKGLVPAVESVLRESAASFGFRTDLQAIGLADCRIDQPTEAAAYRVVQEAVTNAGMHGGCSHVSVVMTRSEGSLLVVVEDDGRGFDVNRVSAESDPCDHFGLEGMRERADLLGGDLVIESTRGAGTAIHLRLPLEREDVGESWSKHAS